MKNTIAMFFSTKYWSNGEELKRVSRAITSEFGGEEVFVVVDGDLTEILASDNGDTLIVIPCSGSVQPHIIRACEKFKNVIMFAGYVEGNFDNKITDQMLYCNAGPTLMDAYCVLKRSGNIRLIKTKKQLEAYLFACKAAEKVRNAKIALIGETEPWVISASRDTELYYDRLGVRIEKLKQSELIELYNNTTFDEAKDIYEYYKNGAKDIVEPTEQDLVNTARMAKAMVTLLKLHQCDGMAIACFNLIANTGVNPCIGVSYINGKTPYFAACEGDIDSAVTMLFIRALTKSDPFMANPSLQKNDHVNFAHCTAPTEECDFVLRNHHETGVGVSLQVNYGIGKAMSLYRYSGVLNAITINKGISVEGKYEPNCRTQVCVEINDYKNYVDNALGCHQIMTFDDSTMLMSELANILGIEIR